MTIKQFIEKAIEGGWEYCRKPYLLVRLWDGKAMLALWEGVWKTEKAIRKTVEQTQVLFGRVPEERQRHELVYSTAQRQKDSETSEVFSLSGGERKGFLFKRVQKARMRQALLTLEALRKDFVEAKKTNHTTNSIEGFWSQLKRSLDGTHHAVSPKYLQSYVDEFSWRYNHRGETLFPLLVARLALSNAGSVNVKA